MSMPSSSDAPPRAVRVRPVPAVTRSIAILRLLGRRKQGMGVKAIADELGLVPSTCLHILRVLVAEGLVQVDGDTKRYVLGSGMVSLARSVLDSGGFATLAQAGLERIAKAHGITVLGVEITARNTSLVLAAARPDHPLQLHADVGSVFPAMTSATGRLVAAHANLDTAALRKAFDTIQWDQPPSFDDWLVEVELAGLNGWTIDRDRFKNGITAVAIGVLSPERTLTHTLVGMGLSGAMTDDGIRDLVRDLQREAAAISQQLSLKN